MKINYKIIIIIGFVLLLSSLFINLYNYLNKISINKEEKNKMNYFFDSNKEIEFIKNEEEYIAVLEIPKINLKKGIYSKDSKLNDVDRNIYLLEESTFPNEYDNSHIILASHSGNSNISYFKNLHRLNIGDDIHFYFNGIKYMYKINNIYEVQKTGKIELLLNENDISLITCMDDDKQIIYSGDLYNIN